jgi:hypothetical protein
MSIPGTGKHGHYQFSDHGHVDCHSVSLLHAFGQEDVGELAHLFQQLLVCDLHRKTQDNLMAVSKGLLMNRYCDKKLNLDEVHFSLSSSNFNTIRKITQILLNHFCGVKIVSSLHSKI